MSDRPRLRVLVVDDDDVDRMAVRRALRSAELEADVSEADRVAATRKALEDGRFDCIVVDFNLPDGDAHDVLELSGAVDPPVPCVVLTGQGDEGLAVELMKGGARDYIPKHLLSPARLTQSLRYVVQVATAEAETRRARRAQQFLVDVSAQLAQSLDPDETVERVARLAIPEMADVSVLFLVEDDEVVRRAAAAHVNADLEALLSPGGRLSPPPDNAPDPVFDTLRSGETEILEEVDEAWLRRMAKTEEGLGFLRDLGLRSAVTLPLVARSRTLGALFLGQTREGRSFEPHDVTVLRNLASRAALALDNARLYAELREEARIVDTLHRVGEATTAELDLDRVAEAVAQEAQRALGAESATFVCEVHDEHADPRTVTAHAGAGEDTRGFPPASKEPLFHLVRAGGSVRVGDVGGGPADDDAPPPEAYRSYLAVPVLAGSGKVVGGIFLGHSEPKVFGERAERLAQGIAGWAGVAVENARLYEGAQRAARARDEMLAVVSHDLRNPLNVIATSAALILEIPLPEDKERLQLETIRRTTERMNRLIQDLLDVTGMEAGKLSIDPDVATAAELLAEAEEMMRPLAEEEGLTFVSSPPPEEGRVRVDRARVQQVFSNLAGNAVKFTPSGGKVMIGADVRADQVAFWVEDTGPGIPEDEIPFLFDRFWRGAHRPESGTGLGLPIAKGIVEVHGGSLEVDSEEGRGTRFTFFLPRLESADEPEPDAVGSPSASS